LRGGIRFESLRRNVKPLHTNTLDAHRFQPRHG
jgi:hypothetical protein